MELVPGAYEPLTQAEQLAEPGTAKLPAGQGLQLALPAAATLPAAHCWHEFAAKPLNAPSGHVLQSPPRKNLPAGQAQTVAAHAGGSCGGSGQEKKFEPPERWHTERPLSRVAGTGPVRLLPERSSRTDTPWLSQAGTEPEMRFPDSSLKQPAKEEQCLEVGCISCVTNVKERGAASKM